MDNEQPHQELVKCVVVGDTAVGKTRLICARACNKKFSLTQLLNTHVPTVFAIDQYRIYKEVLERSCVIVDGVNVSLRLWDTFGDHDKDRRFAYGRSDVVLLCFSVANPASLRNCLIMWYPEIRKFCPNTPILLVGCKNDLRYVCKDEEYLSYCRDRSPLVRPTRECDLVMPGEGRVLAKEIGVEYFEASVLTYYGVKEVFDNVIRAALIARRQQRFWMTNLKRVQKPIPQVPFCPPKPKLLLPSVSPSTMSEDFHCLYQCGTLTDLVVISGNTIVYAHRFLVSAASPAFHKLLFSNTSDSLATRRSSDSSMLSGVFGDSATGNFNSETECLLNNEQNQAKVALRLKEVLKRRSSMYSVTCDRPGVHRELNHPPFQSISIDQWDEKIDSSTTCSHKSPRLPFHSFVPIQTVVTMTKQVSPHVLQQLFHFMYTGSFFCRRCQLSFPNLNDLHTAAEALEMTELKNYTANLLKKEESANGNFAQDYMKVLQGRLKELCLDGGFSSDILIQLEDSTVVAHRPLLMVRCDMMYAMFSGDFRESNAKVVAFPGVKQRAFQVLLEYLYTDQIPMPLKIREYLPVVELANRLCLPRLITLVENEIVDLLIRYDEAGSDINEDCLYMLENMQLHNADQLVDWILTHLSTSYNHICLKYTKVLRDLHPENQAFMNRNRWPPVWYLKDFDYYERCVIERQREDCSGKALKRTAGCLCFSSKSRRKADKSAYCSV